MSVLKALLRAVVLAARGIGLGVALLGLYAIYYGISLGAVEAGVFGLMGGVAVLIGIDIIRNPHHLFEYLASDDDEDDR